MALAFWLATLNSVDLTMPGDFLSASVIRWILPSTAGSQGRPELGEIVTTRVYFSPKTPSSNDLEATNGCDCGRMAAGSMTMRSLVEKTSARAVSRSVAVMIQRRRVIVARRRVESMGRPNNKEWRQNQKEIIPTRGTLTRSSGTPSYGDV